MDAEEDDKWYVLALHVNNISTVRLTLHGKLTCDWVGFSVVHWQPERSYVTSEENRVPTVVVHLWPGTRRRSDDLRQNVGEHQQQVRDHVTPPKQHRQHRCVINAFWKVNHCTGYISNARPNQNCYTKRANIITFCGCMLKPPLAYSHVRRLRSTHTHDYC